MRFVFLLLLGFGACAQTVCPPPAAYSACDLVFELNASESQAHPKPYLTVDLQAEFQSPRHKTYLMPGFWDGGVRHVIRFTPTEPGEWSYRVTSNIGRFNGKEGKVTATASDAYGFVQPANLHHWKYSEANRPHLWMGDASYRFAFMDDAMFQQMLEKRSQQKFNHIQGLVLGEPEQLPTVYPKPDEPNLEHFKRLDARLIAMNRKGITADLILAPKSGFAKLFSTPDLRTRFLRFIVGRYAPMNVTWQLMQEFDADLSSRALLQELGPALKRLDPYDHPRSAHAIVTSSPLFADGWMNYVLSQSFDDQIGAVEHQLYPAPFVNSGFAIENSGAGANEPSHADADTTRHRLWNATMDGQYPTFGNTGTYGGKFPVQANYLDSPGARQMTVWYSLMAETRHWELEPYFDLDGGRAVALEGIEYLIYVEKPTGPIEVNMEQRSYDVAWIDPATGEETALKNFKGLKFTGEPPSTAHDWLLHISREGEKRSMLKSYRFDSREPGLSLQEAEQGIKQTPFDIAQPANEELHAGNSYPYQAHVKKQTRGTRSMMYLWTGDVTADGQGFRVLGTGEQGKFTIPPGLLKSADGVIDIRVWAVNAFGKLYQADKIYRVTK